MHDVSDRFKASLRYSRTVLCKAHLMRHGEMIAEDLPILSGNITDDAAALVRKRIDLQLPGIQEIMDLLPADAPDHGGLWPIGNELHLYTGVDFEDGSEPEYIHNGVFRVNRPRMTDTGSDITVAIGGYDRARTIQRAKFTTPYTIRSGTNYITAIRDLLLSRAAWLTEDDFDFITTDFTTPVLVFTHEDDPWEMAVKMAASLGAQLFWDHHGRAVIRPEPDLSVNLPVFEYCEGEDAIVTGITRDLDDDDGYNGIVVSAENSSNSTPIRAEVWDTDTSSPTYYDPKNAAASFYGAVPKFVTSEFVTTYDQALQMARAELRRELGIVEHIDFTSIVNPLHESNDVITLRRQRLNVDNVYILESFRAGIGSNGTMSGTTRKRRAQSDAA